MMMLTKKNTTPVKSYTDDSANFSNKKKLVARWEKVEDRLVCRWIST
jgi:hypothetical protein